MTGTPKLWGGRFEGGVHSVVDDFTRALSFDRRLAEDDLVGSLAHARMLWERGIIDPDSAKALLEGLSGMLRDLQSGELVVEGPDEDVHSWIERELTARVGAAGGRLHTGRSRNDQVATAMRLYLRRRLIEVEGAVAALMETLRRTAEGHLETFLPGYTHLQRGQPVSLAHHLLAHLWSLEADARRFRAAFDTAGISPLGAAALAGTPHPIDPRRSAALLGLPRVFANSMWAVADRDYVLEASFACALVMVHLSRWAEEIVLWTSPDVGFATLSDSVAKGSSIMPQKRNPEPAEILRGKSGRVIGDLVAHLVQLKGLPLTYNSDLQEDKEALFDALDTASSSLRLAGVLTEGLEFCPQQMAQALHGSFLTATDLADGLVEQGLSFRDAHHQTGGAVRLAEERGCELWELELEDLCSCCPQADADLLQSLRPGDSVRRHSSPGGPAPERVREQLAAAAEVIAVARSWCERQLDPPIYVAHLQGRLLAEELG